MDFVYLSNEALVALENYMDKRDIKPLMDDPPLGCAAEQFYVSLKFKDVKGSMDTIRKEIIEPACFQIACEINKLDKQFNTFYRITPDSNIYQWVRSEINNKSITVVKAYDIRKNCEILSITLGIVNTGGATFKEVYLGDWDSKCGVCGSKDIVGSYRNKNIDEICLCSVCAKHAKINGYREIKNGS